MHDANHLYQCQLDISDVLGQQGWNRSLVGLWFQSWIDEKVIAVTGSYHGNLWRTSGTARPPTRDLIHSPNRIAMGLYERLLEERAEEVQRMGGPLPRTQGLDSKVLVRRLEDSKGRPGYAPDLAMMHRLIKRGTSNVGEGMRLGSLKANYRKEYGELKAGWHGQQELL